MWKQLLAKIHDGDRRSLARAISLVENDHPDGLALLENIHPNRAVPIVGVTGPPGAGKSTLVDALVRLITQQQKNVAVLCVDPSSPFHMGAILGDRIRMSEWYDHPQVFIRSLATRGHMGGLNHKIIEITELLSVAGFDLILVETVGVGQSEIEIAGLADTTVVVVVPEAGDEIQTMKAGLMEIADIFVVNKSDRPDADAFVKNLRAMLAPADGKKEIPVIKTIASRQEGVEELYQAIITDQQQLHHTDRRLWLLTEKLYELIQSKRMRSVSKEELKAMIENALQSGHLNLYKLANQSSDS